jgi:hypothetical protein
MGFLNLTIQRKSFRVDCNVDRELEHLTSSLYISLKPGVLELSNSIPAGGTKISKITKSRDT